MDSGFYAVCTGLAAQLQALDLVAHNLANLSTTGYRGQKMMFQSLMAGYASVPENLLNTAINNFAVLSNSHTDLTSGSLVRTGNPLDLGIAGPAFFAVRTPQNVLYTRNGSFHITPDGNLVSEEGYPVLTGQGPIGLPNGTVGVSSDGTISVDGAIAGKIRLVEFASGTELEAAGNALYTAPLDSVRTASSSSIRQGMLEASNVSAVESVVELITVQRNAEMMQRALTVFDSEFNQTAVQDLPKV